LKDFNRFITKLHLIDSHVSFQSVELLKTAKFKFLTSVNLNKNRIGIKGAEYLKYCEWLFLKGLHLHGCHIQNSGLKYLAQVWKFNRILNLPWDIFLLLRIPDPTIHGDLIKDRSKFIIHQFQFNQQMDLQKSRYWNINNCLIGCTLLGGSLKCSWCWYRTV
jgi:Ran GTPase-activating protein (RanGAP) involved in mRNA processing and transport